MWIQMKDSTKQWQQRHTHTHKILDCQQFMFWSRAVCGRTFVHIRMHTRRLWSYAPMSTFNTWHNSTSGSWTGKSPHTYHVHTLRTTAIFLVTGAGFHDNRRGGKDSEWDSHTHTHTRYPWTPTYKEWKKKNSITQSSTQYTEKDLRMMYYQRQEWRK